jgi:hypothetical protein
MDVTLAHIFLSFLLFHQMTMIWLATSIRYFVMDLFWVYRLLNLIALLKLCAAAALYVINGILNLATLSLSTWICEAKVAFNCSILRILLTYSTGRLLMSYQWLLEPIEWRNHLASGLWIQSSRLACEIFGIETGNYQTHIAHLFVSVSSNEVIPFVSIVVVSSRFRRSPIYPSPGGRESRPFVDNYR